MYVFTIMEGVECLLTQKLEPMDRARCGIVARNMFRATTGMVACENLDTLSREHINAIRAMGKDKHVGVVNLLGEPTHAADYGMDHMMCALVIRGQVYIMQSFYPRIVFQRRVIPVEKFANALKYFLTDPDMHGPFERTPERLDALHVLYGHSYNDRSTYEQDVRDWQTLRQYNKPLFLRMKVQMHECMRSDVMNNVSDYLASGNIVD